VLHVISMIAIRSIDISTHSSSGDGSLVCTPGSAAEDAVIVGAGGNWRAQVRLARAGDRERLTQEVAAGLATLVIGDFKEADAASPPYVNATLVSVDARTGTISAMPSLTGLPPVFLFSSNGRASLSSPFIPRAASGSLAPDLDGVADTLRWGYPIDGRTLFAALRVGLANASVTIRADGSATAAEPDPWPEDPEFSRLTREEIVQEQVAAFSAAAARFDVNDAFVSLSGGLDSRTSLAGLLSRNLRPSCVTMAGSSANLDARLAEAVCKAGGLEHHTVLLDASFVSRAPDLVMRTAALTGGVSCLSQTVDSFLYQQLAGRFGTRISGNLGNQVGRGGVEGLSAYRPQTDVLSAAVRECLGVRPVRPWFIERLAGGDYGAVLFGQEVHFWSISNYIVGSAGARQLTPYADRRLLNLARAAFTRDPQLCPPTWETLRARDLRHRLRGTERALSFQREFLARSGGVIEHVPLNWGWRAAGGWSPQWRARAMLSAADAAMTKYSTKPGLGPVARWFGSKLGHRSSLVDWPSLVKTRLREVTHDTFGAAIVRQSGIFDMAGVDRMLAEHFHGKVDHHATVSRCLEIALGVLCRSVA
jgi:hypothetical protein